MMMASRKASRSISGTSTRARPSSFMEGGAAQKRGRILVFSVHAKLTKTLPNNHKIRHSLPKVEGSMKVAKQLAEWLQKALERMRARLGSNQRPSV